MYARFDPFRFISFHFFSFYHRPFQPGTVFGESTRDPPPGRVSRNSSWTENRNVSIYLPLDWNFINNIMLPNGDLVVLGYIRRICMGYWKRHQHPLFSLSYSKWQSHRASIVIKKPNDRFCLSIDITCERWLWRFEQLLAFRYTTRSGAVTDIINRNYKQRHQQYRLYSLSRIYS